MRFDKKIEIFSTDKIKDGLGGYLQSEKRIGTFYCCYDSNSNKVIMLGQRENITDAKIDNEKYRTKNLKVLGNKTYFEVYK